MEVTIEITEHEHDDFEVEVYRNFFGRTKVRSVPLGKKTRYHVELTIIPTEEERAVILKYKLDELAMEEEPAFSEEFIAQRERDQIVTLGNADPESALRVIRDNVERMRRQTTQTLIGQYFDNPYVKEFDVRQDAHRYADKLETKILPFIKNQIEYYRTEAYRADSRKISL